MQGTFIFHCHKCLAPWNLYLIVSLIPVGFLLSGVNYNKWDRCDYIHCIQIVFLKNKFCLHDQISAFSPFFLDAGTLSSSKM